MNSGIHLVHRNSKRASKLVWAVLVASTFLCICHPRQQTVCFGMNLHNAGAMQERPGHTKNCFFSLASPKTGRGTAVRKRERILCGHHKRIYQANQSRCCVNCVAVISQCLRTPSDFFITRPMTTTCFLPPFLIVRIGELFAFSRTDSHASGVPCIQAFNGPDPCF